MASAENDEVNRRKAKERTELQADQSKARARSSNRKAGGTDLTIEPTLTLEESKQLEERIQNWVGDMQPRDPVEHDLVCRAARLSYLIERGEQLESNHLAHRVKAELSKTEQVSSQRVKKVQDLGLKLLNATRQGNRRRSRPAKNDDPAVLVFSLEETAEGCCWLLEQWVQYRMWLKRESWWGMPEMFDFIRLQGKQAIEAVFDPALNSILLAWDALVPDMIDGFWAACKDRLPAADPALLRELQWHEITCRPRDAIEAVAVLYSVVDEHMRRLQKLLAVHEEMKEADAVERAHFAALDSGPVIDRHRRLQSARLRELLQTLDRLRKMRKGEAGRGKG